MTTTDDKPTWFAKIGPMAKGVVCCLLGYLAQQAAFGAKAVPTKENLADRLGAWGTALLWIVGLGLPHDPHSLPPRQQRDRTSARIRSPA